ncbi:hypothetical protein M3221_16780 [Domibacillus indicus]|uniref:hypothetical protein n=1 Tax=Domibacillus indicus TaxID=1437523 RepID=UPI00203CB456|nr:hypothetical protein [Domibacillus indicus]MCM3790044.1 hypothetical protein [Domibacillus indicus]
MGYLEQFVRNKRRKKPSTVLTARLSDSLYEDFKGQGNLHKRSYLSPGRTQNYR